MCTLFALSESIRMLKITAKYIILPDLINPDLNNSTQMLLIGRDHQDEELDTYDPVFRSESFL